MGVNSIQAVPEGHWSMDVCPTRILNRYFLKRTLPRITFAQIYYSQLFPFIIYFKLKYNKGSFQQKIQSNSIIFSIGRLILQKYILPKRLLYPTSKWMHKLTKQKMNSATFQPTLTPHPSQIKPSKLVYKNR